jgi:DNA-binding transcriptional LysR family regulator
MTVELRQLRYLVAVVDAGSFSAAARALLLSQPTLSLAIAQLERHLDVRLLDRGPRGLTPTRAGTITVEHARRVLAAVDELHAAVRPLVDRRNRVLRVGLFVGGVGELTAPLLEALPERLPGLRVAPTGLGTDGLVAPLLADEVDVTLGWGPLEDDRLQVHALFREERIVVVGARHPLADTTEVATRDLLDLPHAGSLDGEPEAWESWWNLVPERNGEQPARLAVPDAADQVTQLRGHALRPTIATLPRHVAQAFPGGFLGVRYLRAPQLSPATAVVVSRRKPDPLVSAVVRLITQVAAELVPAVPGLLPVAAARP